MKKRQGLTFVKKEKKIKPHHFTGLFVLLFWMAAVSFIAFVLVLVFGTKTAVIGDGMNPVLYNFGEVLINKSSFVLFKPRVGQIIAFYPNGNKNSYLYLKRVVAVGGDEVLIENGHLYVNGSLFEDEDLYETMEYAGLAEEPIVLAKDEYFVLGDNRNDSEDSRYGNIGPVKRDDIIGRVWFRFKTDDKKAKIIF